MKKNALYAQSGGVTSVINSSAYGVIKSVMETNEINELFIGKNGLNGVFEKKFFKLSEMDIKQIELLPFTPASAFGSCRKKIKKDEELKKLFNVFQELNIKYFFYNGGNDSMDTANKVNDYAIKNGYDLVVIGIPKTVDNDLFGTDHTPGYGSAAKFLSVSMYEGLLDVRSMAKDSTKVFVLETMGRHAGWLTAAASLCSLNSEVSPKVILLPEVAFDKQKFLSLVEESVMKDGFCGISVSEGIKDDKGAFLSDLGYLDNFGNKQLGNVGNFISGMVFKELNIKVHTAIPDYLQRSGRHISSKADVEEAIMVGKKAVEFALKGLSGFMVTIDRLLSKNYEVEYKMIELSNVANHTKYLPKEFIGDNNMSVNENFYKYASPLINGEFYPKYKNGIPIYSFFNY